VNITEDEIFSETEAIAKNGFERNLAFIIGINNYSNGISPLKTAVNDAKKLVEVLREKHGYKVWVCLDEVATLTILNQLLERTLPEQVSENDRLLFYFAGHGVALNGDDGPAGYLIPQDAKGGDTDSYLPMTKLHDALNKLPCRHFLGIFDCCFAGAFRWSSMRDLLTAPEVIHKERYDRFITDPAWQIITSSASDQKALDNFNLDTQRGQVGNHSPFAAALLEALEGAADAYPPAENGKPAGDGVITATELYLHLRDRVEISTEKYRLRQTPSIWCLNKHDKGEYIFLTPGHELNLPPAPPLDESQNPYRGLKSFDEEHSELFFGRTELVEKLQAFVKIHPLTVVLGASGSGKSSVVKAGLIPILKKETKETSNKWCILSPIRPGETPFRALNNALVNAQLPKVELQNPQKSLTQSIAVWGKNNLNSKLLIFIDQSEEIITLCHSENERKEFFQQILTAINAHRDKLRVVLTLRSDLEPQVRDASLTFVPTVLKLGNTELKNNWQSGRFIVPAMTRGELREAIEKPAEAQVMYFQPHELVEQLIDEVDNMPGALPLLSFALSELFLKYLQRQRNAENRGITIDRDLTQEDYQELGGVMRSLTQRADEEYQALVEENPAYEQVIRHVMLRMVALGGSQLARRQVPLSELEYPPEKNGLVKQVIERFTNARLLVKGEDAEGHSYVEPAHDALMRSWGRLLNWVKEEKNLRLQRRLTPAALEWKSQQQARFLWNADPYLDVLQKEVLNSENNWLNKVETEFVQRSVGKKSFNTKRNWGIAIAVMLGLSSLAIWALIGLRDTQIEQIRNLRQSTEVKRRSNQELEALLDVLKVGKLLDNWLLHSFKPDAEIEQLRRTLPKVVYTVQELNRLEGHRGLVTTVDFQSTPNGEMIVTKDSEGIAVWHLDGRLEKKYTYKEVEDILKQSNGNLYKTLEQKFLLSVLNFSPDGKMFAGFDSEGEGTVALWNSDGTLHKTFQAHKTPNNRQIMTVRFSPDSQMIATGSWEYEAKLWKLDGTLYKTLKGHGGTVNALDFSRDGQIIASGSNDTKVKLWNRDGTFLKTLEGHQGEVWDVSISPDSQIIASASNDGTVKLWNRDGTLLKTLEGHRNTVRAVRFSADGHILASASDDGTVKLWRLGSTPLTILDDYTDAVYTVRFNPDGKTIATTTGHGHVKLWQRDGTLLKSERWQHGPITTLEFSPDGELIVSGSGDRTVRLSGSDGSKGRLLEGHTGELQHKEVLAVSFSPDSQIFAIGDIDGKIELWNRDGTLKQTLPGHKATVWGLSFSPDGQILASASADGTVKLWNRDGSLEQTLSGHGSQLLGVAFSPDQQPDNQIIAAASADGTVKLWKRDGTELKPLKGHSNVVRAVAFSPNGQLIATASYDKTVKLWNRDGTLLKTFYGHNDLVNTVAFSPDGKRLASASNDKTVNVWNLDLDLDVGGLRKHTCDRMRDYLKNNPKVDESDRHLCDDVSNEKADAQSFQNPGTPPSSSGGRFIVNLLSGKCIDVLGAPGTANDAKLQLWNCETSGINLGNGLPTNQKWTFGSDGFIRNSSSGKCIDVKGGPGITNGAPLVLWDCETSGFNRDNGSPTDQTWTLGSDGFIRNSSSGKCIDVKGRPGITNGAPLVLWDCETSGLNRDNGSPTDQRWGLQ
jgi:WD40 repeat protein